MADYTEYFMHCPSDTNYVSGDYRSEYCQKLFQEADVVVTNPPFSLFRDFVATLEKNNLKYIIMGNMNAITYKEIFPLMKANKLFWGASLRGTKCSFKILDDYEGNNVFKENNQRYAKVNNAIWFTNMDLQRHHENLILTQNYDPQKYPKYDNYDAIEVSKVKDIPMDYDEVMGVPITFLEKYNPDQFEIIKFRKGDDDKDLALTVSGKTKYPYFRILIRKKLTT